MASLYELRELPVEGDYWSNTEGLVRQVNDNIYTVNLDNKTCSCTLFQENRIPCSHAITIIPYMAELLTFATWKKTYSSNFPLIDISNLLPLPLSECHPPLTRVPRGRPKKERFRKDNIRGPRGEAAAQAIIEPVGDGDNEVWVLYYCSTCGERSLFYYLPSTSHIKLQAGYFIRHMVLKSLTL